MKTLYLQTEDGKTVYTTGRFQFSLTKGRHKLPSGYYGDFSRPVNWSEPLSTPKERATFLKKVETLIGKNLVWVKGPDIEIIGL